MKRFFDILFATILIILLSIPILVISLFIKLTSKGPVFFKQRRIGKDTHEFIMIKFRTMKIDTPNVATHLLEDPNQYITSIGKFLRKTSLDELPQLFNILSGRMSFVGPRPALYNQYDVIAMREKKGVNSLVPGLTGWAQINGRDEIPNKKKVALDKYYLDKQSIFMDLKILVMTFFKVLKSEGVKEGSNID